MTQLDALKENMDSHIKELKRRISYLENLPTITKENADNIQYLYELIYKIKDEIEKLKHEINAVKLIQIISLKDK
mgnify:CR=1 FL=1